IRYFRSWLSLSTGAGAGVRTDLGPDRIAIRLFPPVRAGSALRFQPHDAGTIRQRYAQEFGDFAGHRPRPGVDCADPDGQVGRPLVAVRMDRLVRLPADDAGR